LWSLEVQGADAIDRSPSNAGAASVRRDPGILVVEVLFVADRRARSNGDMGVVVWLPGQVSEVLVAIMPRALRGFETFPVPDLIAV